MLISVKCPRCGTNYQVQDALRGKAMRCPLATCRHVFIVNDPPPPDRPRQSSGTVGDLVPLVPVDPPGGPGDVSPPGRTGNSPASTHVADALEMLPAEPAAGTAGPAWATAPPPVRRQDTAPPPAADWSAGPPPVRRKDDTEVPNRAKTRKMTAPPPSEPVLTPIADEPAPPPPRGRWGTRIILPLLLVTVIGGAVGGYFVYMSFIQREERMRKEADDAYAKGLHRNAADKYKEVLKLYPDSEFAGRYQFRQSLADTLDRIQSQPDDPTDILDNIDQLLEDNDRKEDRKDDPKKRLLSEHADAIGKGLVKLMTDFGEKAAEQPDLAAGSKAFEKADKVAKRLKDVRLFKGHPAPDLGKIAEAAKKLKAAIARAEARKKYLDQMKALAADPSYRSLLFAERLEQEEGQKFPELAGEVKAILARIKASHLESLKECYKREAAPPAGRAFEEEDEPAILIDALRRGQPGNPPPNDPLVLSLCRGVLYGQGRTTGRVRWAMRVGIDTAALPVRVPAGVGVGERILVLSSDAATLSAVDVRGNTLWRYRLDAPSLGRPVVVGNRAYLGTVGGEVHEIELAEGRLVGRFVLGHRLTLSGVREPGTSRLYFAAEDGCVYVLRVGDNPGVESLVYSRHPAGSLRGERILVPADGKGGKGLLILTRADGLRGVELQVFELPATADSLPVALAPRPRLDGWTWFPSYHDAEKIAMLTDAGVLGIFGIRQAGSRDKALVPLLPEGGLRLGGSGEAAGEAPERAAVMQIQGDDLWALARGRLRRLKQVWDIHAGPELVPVWNEAPLLGSPLHQGQAFIDPAGRGRLVAVTRPPGQPTSLSTCIDDETGRVLWQRQLGLVARGEAMPLEMGGGPPLSLVQDQGGSLFALDPLALVPRPGAQWVPGRIEPIAGPLADNPRQPPAFLPMGDGSWLVVACPGEGTKLVIRHVKAGAGRTAVVEEREASLPDTLAGRPALMQSRLLLPLADGTLVSLPVPLPAKLPEPEGGTDWRSERLGRETPGLVTALGGNRFVACDGGRGLSVWDWPAGKAWEALPRGRGSVPTLEMPARVLFAPVLLPGNPTRLVVADDSPALSLAEVAADGSLKVLRRWDLAAAPTSLPFVRGTPAGVRVGVIVGRSRLAWIDPGKAAHLAYPKKDGDPLVGEPRLAGGVLVVADQSGRYVGLSPETLEEIGKGHALRGSISPAASPTPFLKDRLLAPLTDGTLLLLGEEKFQEKPAEKAGG